jgi:DNA-binding HxlR family transcriptional regulator
VLTDLLQHEHDPAVLDLAQREAERGGDRRRGQLAGGQPAQEGQAVGAGGRRGGGQRVGPAVRALAHGGVRVRLEGGHRATRWVLTGNAACHAALSPATQPDYPAAMESAALDWRDTDSTRCSVARTAAVVGDGWTVLLLRDLFNGLRRFDELAVHLGVARNVLTRRLAALTEAGVITRVPYREPGARARHEYRLTDAGRDLLPVLLAMAAWGDRHRAGADGPPVLVEHAGCGAAVHVELRCGAGHRLEPRTDRLRSLPGPGAARRAG